MLGIPRCNEPDELFAATVAAVRASVWQPGVALVVDNGDEPLAAVSGFGVMRPGRNLGCAGAWNAICLRAFAELGAENAVIINGDCAVAPDTFERLHASHAGIVLGHNFSCFRISREVWQRVGPFDEMYWPVYWEDTDYRRRMALLGVEVDEWPLVEEARPSHGRTRCTTGVTHGWGREDGSYQGWRGEKDRWFREHLEKNRQRYISKWGGEPGRETHAIPFGTGLDP